MARMSMQRSPGLFARDWLSPMLTLAGLIVLWEVASRLFNVPVWLLPAPSEIAFALYERGSGLIEHSAITFYETIAGFLLAIIFGVPLAVAVSHSRALSNTIFPLILITQSVPKVAFAPILLIWLGYGYLPKIVVAFLVAFFPIVVDTATGLRSPLPQVLDLARQLSASQFQIYTKIRFPSALPHFFSGLKVAITLSVIGAVIGEFVGAEKGLGFLVIESTSHFKTPLAFGAMALLGLMSIVLFGVVVFFERIACPWYGREH